MQTIRSFIAMPLGDGVRRRAVRLIQRLQRPDDAIRWVPTDNLHLTLKFLGDVDNVQVPEICDVLREVCQPYRPFELTFRGTGAFPRLDRPRVLYAGVEDPSHSLVPMVGELERALAELGFKPEPRDYRPHLTLGRTRSGRRRASDEVMQRLHQEESVELGEMQADSVQLIASFLEKTGPRYHVMDTIELE